MNMHIRKTITEIKRNSRVKVKNENGACFICKQTRRIIDSHTVPKFVLKNISLDGKLLTTKILNYHPFMKEEVGKNEAGVFNLLCAECDSTMFRDYENPDNYESEPSKKMLAQIALKCALKGFYRSSRLVANHDVIRERVGSTEDFFMDSDMANRGQDKADFKTLVAESSRAIDSKWEEYNVLYFEKLKHVVPFACQESITLAVDLNDKIINDVYNLCGKIQFLFVCIFPLEQGSIALLFYKKHKKGVSNKYDIFRKQFNKLNVTEKQKLISYIAFKESEDVLCNPTKRSFLAKNKEVLQAARDQGIISVEVINGRVNYDQRTAEIVKIKSLQAYKNFPNLLADNP